jgi:hypothetical protein
MEKELTFDDIIACLDTPVVKIYVSNWNGSVFLKLLSAFEREKWESFAQKELKLGTPTGLIRSTLISKCLCDASGRLIVTDIKQLATKNAAVIDMLFKEILKINLLSDDSVSDAEKN